MRAPRSHCHGAAWPVSPSYKILLQCGMGYHLPGVLGLHKLSGLGFPQPTVYCLGIVVILLKQAPQVFEYLHPFQHISMNRNLLACHSSSPADSPSAFVFISETLAETAITKLQMRYRLKQPPTVRSLAVTIREIYMHNFPF